MILRGFFAIEMRMGLDELEKYLDITEKYLQKAKDDFEAWINKEMDKLSPKERNEFGEFYSDTYWEYAETFPRILRSSFFVSAYSLLEHKLAITCGWLKKDKQIPISWSDIRGDTLEQFKLYCKLAHLDLRYDDQNWQEINNYRRIRNCIVHNRGLIEGSTDEKDLRAYAEKKHITDRTLVGLIRLQDQIALTQEFCNEVTKTIWAFLSKVLEAYELQKQNQKADS
jgi:hypothetical protein